MCLSSLNLWGSNALRGKAWKTSCKKLNHHHFVSLTNNIKKWWIWGYWISPLMYTQNAISTNDFLGHSWSEVLNGSSNLVECLLRQNGTGLVSELFQRNKALIKELSIPPPDSF
ncbi:hypothetical protein IHE45_13G093300 [Dioscorea alata]|uniref:Uncharacterized protein n=1 Tax=Dioscorea alata TaxID=55571 RepID=A0ACB7UZY3_DIOAL|nr:hypothetical protein IHE45_13G093300 [Dioscorea alata]